MIGPVSIIFSFLFGAILGFFAFYRYILLIAKNLETVGPVVLGKLTQEQRAEVITKLNLMWCSCGRMHSEHPDGHPPVQPAPYRPLSNTELDEMRREIEKP
jgi:hypothetical protein